MATDESLEVAVGRLLAARRLTLSVAESCTGGLIMHRLTNVAGSSAYLMGGMVVYSYEAKVKFAGVQQITLDQFGAVSAETASEMARGVRAAFETDFALAVTGIAGPGGGTPSKPVGLVYIALDSAHGIQVERHVWQSDREGNKAHSAEAALALLYRCLTEA
ncbi:MAG: competence protein ComA [Candidatus Thermofonsia Clade 1 bacterium]|jgi:nicotinamide-nucleotide amidase|uniref:Competence protein ComA n=1 Tax=Candidatus Thermofonsia Clade 1 bacterium TaxID=2364210 RepID=A0A2M8P1P3_9CHLR|nr:MAG: competence protein ComA [Candidatus Thermofonsia Clade 1 bacterium]